MEESAENKLRCQHIGCNEFFTVEDNPEGACTYHPGPPVFHDGGKEWGCCKQRSYDFGLFMGIPGGRNLALQHHCFETLFSLVTRCTKGKHSSEKPAKPAASPNKPIFPPPAAASSQAGVTADCSRCRQGFFCADHRSLPGVQSKPVPPAKPAAQAPPVVPPPKKEKKVVGLNEVQICKHKGCGQKFRERDNHETACKYHPGPAVFHDRMRGWACCDVHVKDFDEFVEIRPCKEGWHDADPS